MEQFIAPVVGLVGVVIGALLVGWQQRSNTRALIQSEYRKLSAQIAGQSKARFRGRKEDWILEAVPELIAASDPELHTSFDYVGIVTLIHRIQVVLDVDNPPESALNHATTILGLAVQAVKSGEDRNTLLEPQSKVVEATREFFRAMR